METRWKAKVGTPSLDGGMLRVSVDFINGNECLSETFETNQKQPKTWLREQVLRKLRELEHLDGLPELHASITPGEEITHDYYPELSPEAAKWKGNYDRLQKWVSLSSISIADSRHPAFIELHRWLRENFKPEYIEII